MEKVRFGFIPYAFYKSKIYDPTNDLFEKNNFIMVLNNLFNLDKDFS